jgi:hypothetical protein
MTLHYDTLQDTLKMPLSPCDTFVLKTCSKMSQKYDSIAYIGTN